VSDFAQLLQAVQSSGEIIFMTDREGTFTFVNTQFERVYGYAAGEVVGHSTPRLLKGGAVSPEHYAQFWQRLSNGETVEDEFINRRKDGGLVNIRTTVSPIAGDANAIVGFLAIQRDITARRQVEEALRVSQARLQLITDNVLDLVSQIRLDGTFVYVSPSYETVLGYAPERLIDTSALAPVHPDDLSRVQTTLAETIERGTTGHAEFRYRHADGHYVWLDVAGNVLRGATGARTGVVLSGRDVSVRKQNEEAVRANEQRLRIAVASANMSVFTQDRDFRFTWMYNPQLGATVDELIGKTDVEVLPAALGEQFARIKRRAMDTREPVREEVNIEKNGQKRVFELLVEAQSNSKGEVDSIVGALLDITSRRELEDQLRQSQKLEAIGSLAGGIAHDFNNLLTAILGYAELAIGQLDAGSPIRSDIEEIQRAGHSAESLTRQLLIFSRKGIVQPVLLHLGDVVTRLDKILRRVVGEDIEFIVRLAPDLGSVKADAGQLEQVMMNLVVNARDAMPSGGTLTIEADSVQVTGAFAAAHGGSAVGPFDRLRITDTGCGMSPEVQAQLFTPFFTTKGPEKGTGLGLATAHGIVRQAGGYVSVTSAPGQGSTFAVYLPRVGDQADSAHAAAGPAAVFAGVETILFVEDDAGIRALGARILKHYGYTVLTARHAADALKLAANGHVDLLATDLVMPGMNGQALAERLRESHADMKVLYLSGYTSDSVALHEIQTSGTHFLQKPYTPETLAHAVRGALDAA
jgi:two-component system, cell cycle sensor histidine kinase and response regulator CckA